ncbi:MAG: hypothetical protein ACTHM5_03570 [Ginsengibacter sp.]
MKKIILAVAVIFAATGVKAQSANANALANTIATRMQDSLSLTTAQKDQVLNINLQLHSEKNLIRAQYSNRDSVGIKIQRIENTRDSLYKAVLTENQFTLYKLKKRNLVTAN